MIKILIVENNQDLLNSYKDFIEASELSNKIELLLALNETKALEFLTSKAIDAAVIDLRLDNEELSSIGGNQVISYILNKNLRFPIFILSGNLADANSIDSFFIRHCEKNSQKGKFDVIIDEIQKIYETGITKILGGKGKIETYLNEVFTKNIAHSMPYWIQTAQTNSQETEKSLLRYVLSHIQEHLELAEQGDFENYHNVEFYITPPIKLHTSTVFTADIFKEISSNLYYIVLTPSCDLVERYDKKKNITMPPNAEYITLVEILDLEIIFPDVSKQTDYKTSPTKNQLYQYIPPFGTYKEGGLVAFAKVKSVQLSEIITTTKYQKVCAVSSAFKKDIISRFSHYYARQGQPSLKSS